MLAFDPPPDEPWTLTARWLFPVDQSPLAAGTMTLQGDRIVAVDKQGKRTPDVDLGNVAVLPGFVNAHTHLDLSDALGKCPPSPDFTAWIRQVTQHRLAQTPEDVTRAIERGLRHSLRHGTTLLGDISSGGTSWDALAAAPVRAVVYYEILGLNSERAETGWARAHAWLDAHPRSNQCRPGLSPHAPYSVRHTLFEQTARLAEKKGFFPVSIHVAESQDELQLLRERSGPFVDFLEERGVWDPAGLVPSLDSVLERFARIPGACFVHGNHLKRRDLGRASLIYCPRTHAAFGHPPHPFRKFLRSAALIALGTDSLASNPSLDILGEIRFIHAKHLDLPGAALLRMATLNGAIALGFGGETGSLTPGKSADFVAIRLPDEEADDPHRLILESASEVDAVMFRGRSCSSPAPHD